MSSCIHSNMVMHPVCTRPMLLPPRHQHVSAFHYHTEQPNFTQCSNMRYIVAACQSRPVGKWEDHFWTVGDATLLSSSFPLENDTYNLFSLHSANNDQQPAITMKLTLDRISHRMELDTSASVSLISESTFQPDKTLLPSSVTLKAYTGESMHVSNSVNVCVWDGLKLAEMRKGIWINMYCGLISLQTTQFLSEDTRVLVQLICHQLIPVGE